VLSLESRQWQFVLRDYGFSSSIFAAGHGTKGRLLVGDDSAGLHAALFDAARPAPVSEDVSVLSDVYNEVETETRAWLAVSDNGTAVYAAANPGKTSLVWVDSDGKVAPTGQAQDVYREASLSPDGTKAAVRHGVELWVHDLQRGTRSRLTNATGSNLLPVWSADGTKIFYASNRGGDWDIFSQAADGSAPAEVLLKRPYDQFPLSVLPDGTLIYVEIQPKTGRDLWVLSPDGKTTPLRVTPFNETQAQFSPVLEGGSRWIAYGSDESGQSEIYVQQYPSGTHRTAVSVGGGILPRWSHDGKELFYVSGDALMSVARRPDGTFGTPRKLFDRSNFLFNHRFHSYSVSPDGKHFLVIQRDPGSVPRHLDVILNWLDELDHRAAGR
jgi:dipeptidyl aminopeptidase/acylaminoacyl peptidase